MSKEISGMKSHISKIESESAGFQKQIFEMGQFISNKETEILQMQKQSQDLKDSWAHDNELVLAQITIDQMKKDAIERDQYITKIETESAGFQNQILNMSQTLADKQKEILSISTHSHVFAEPWTHGSDPALAQKTILSLEERVRLLHESNKKLPNSLDTLAAATNHPDQRASGRTFSGKRETESPKVSYL